MTVGKTLREWLQEGEDLYAMALREYQGLEAQLRHLEAQIASKREELNQIAQVIGKPPVAEAVRAARAPLAPHAAPASHAPAQQPPPPPAAPPADPVVSAAAAAAAIPAHAVQIIDTHAPGSIPASRNTIARALTGRGLGG